MKKIVKINFQSLQKKFSSLMLFFLLALPASTNYRLKDFGFGNGGTGGSTSPNYSLEAITGQVNGAQSTSPNYKIGDGLIFTGQANVPIAPTFTNPSSYYNKLKLVLDISSNPTDTKFAIAISTDNFATTNYVQSDNTVGAVLGSEDYQTFASWGGASGVLIIGLAPSTTYYVKVKAMQGRFTETGYGPIASAATVSPTLSFNINVNTVNYGNLVANAVTDSPTITATFSTNAETGGNVYIYGKNAGLRSAAKSYTINSATADLTGASPGFGAQVTSVSQVSGGPLTKISPYDLAASNVGIIDTSVRKIFSSGSPIVTGSGAFVLKAKSVTLTPAANDYSETVTMVASGNF